MQRVEQQLEGPQWLGAVLGLKSDQDHLARADPVLDGCGLAFEEFAAVEVAAQQHVLGIVGVADDNRAFEAGVGHPGLKCRRIAEQHGLLCAHSEGQRTVGVHVSSQHGAGAVEGVPRDLGQHVAHGQLEEVDEGKLFDICLNIWESIGKKTSTR